MPGMTSEPDLDEFVLWFITVTLAGRPMREQTIRAGAERYCSGFAFEASVRCQRDRIEVSYWDEAGTAADAAEMAMSTWTQARSAIGVNDWQLVGVEVLDQTTLRQRCASGRGPELLQPGEIRMG